MPFSEEYRSLAIPRLRDLARFQALLVVTDSCEFEEAHSAIMALAYRLGAGQLSRQLEDDLHDAALEWLLEAIDAVLPEWQAAEALAGKVARDFSHYEAKMREARK